MSKVHTYSIGHFGKYHYTLCLSPQILHKHCFQFLSGLTMAPRENKNNTYAKFGGQTRSISLESTMILKIWGTNKEYHGTFQTVLLHFGDF